MADPRDKVLQDYRKKLLEHKEIDGRLNELREQLKELIELTKQFENVGQIVGEVLKQLTEEKFIVKATNGPRYVVGCRQQLDKSKLKPGTGVAVDPLVYNMSHEDPGNVSYSEIGGLSEQIWELREVIELPLTNPELFQRVGIMPPKGCLLQGPPGMGKALLARAVASQLDYNFFKAVSSSIVDKYIGEEKCLIMPRTRDSEYFNGVTESNGPDTLDPALLKIHTDLPYEQARLDLLKIHAGSITKHGEIDYEAIVKLSDGFNGVDLRNVCTEAGMFAIRADHDFVVQEDFMKAVRKVADSNKLESKLDYKPV
uniref:AAA+ ATPase domain-containing protein n=1 Tax=Macaca nemestrina TaxID=9545 RepID=A0A2K6E2J9_MACNE